MLDVGGVRVVAVIFLHAVWGINCRVVVQGVQLLTVRIFLVYVHRETVGECSFE